MKEGGDVDKAATAMLELIKVSRKLENIEYDKLQKFVPDTQIDRVRGQQFDLRLNSDDKSRLELHYSSHVK